jgi:hypothetical protein
MVFALRVNVQAGQITNSVNIATNLSFYLTLKNDGQPRSAFKFDDLTQYVLIGTATNFTYFRRFPSGNFDFHLFDQTGREMPKSKRGLSFSEEPQKPTRHDLEVEDLKFAGVIVDNEAASYSDLFRAKDMFEITNAGTYELEVRVRICIIMSNGVPDYTAMVDGRNSLPSGYPFADDFGVLESGPLRVKIVKD